MNISVEFVGTKSNTEVPQFSQKPAVSGMESA